MIKRIKVFGERNSGTNFLAKLIKQNIRDIKQDSGYYLGGTGWKHGFPRIKYFKNIDEVLFIFIIRDLDSWLLSMYNNPYSYKSPNKIEDFVSGNLIIDENRKGHDVHIYKGERQNVIDLRYAKIRRYKAFFDLVPNALFINLKDLQENNDKFLNFLNTTYSLKTAEIPVKIEKHTKDGNLSNCNRNYSTVLPSKYYKDVELEKMVNSLKDAYIYKSNIN
jgi:hypothetical protein